jgi:hypothetical protein
LPEEVGREIDLFVELGRLSDDEAEEEENEAGRSVATLETEQEMDHDVSRYFNQVDRPGIDVDAERETVEETAFADLLLFEMQKAFQEEDDSDPDACVDAETDDLDSKLIVKVQTGDDQGFVGVSEGVLKSDDDASEQSDSSSDSESGRWIDHVSLTRTLWRSGGLGVLMGRRVWLSERLVNKIYL